MRTSRITKVQNPTTHKKVRKRILIEYNEEKVQIRCIRQQGIEKWQKRK